MRNEDFLKQKQTELIISGPDLKEMLKEVLQEEGKKM